MTTRDTTVNAHPAEVRRVHDRALAGTPVRSRMVQVGGGRVHLLETGTGSPMVLLHGTNGSALFLLPLLANLPAVGVIAPDRPGQGLSDPIDLPRDRYREAAVGWVDRLLDTLGLESAAVAGHSAGGLWALWYALARPGRVRSLVVIGAPTLPETKSPLPYRLIGTPGIGRLMQRVPPTPKSIKRIARFMGEAETIERHPHTMDLMVAAGHDPVAAATDLAEARALISPFALLSRSGFRRHARIRPDELRRLAVPTLVVWGEHDPLGGRATASAVTEMVPDARLAVLPTGHVPFWGHPDRTAAIIADFARAEMGSTS